jgi:DNA-binding response OmpR family regulator
MNHSKRILLIDDEEVITFGFSLVLKGPGVEVDCAQTFEEAQKCIAEHHYAAAVVDLRLSNSIEIEGFACIRFLRANQNACRIIVLTAYGDKRLREEAKNLGVEFFFEKPMEPEKVRDVLTKFGIYDKPDGQGIVAIDTGALPIVLGL